MSDTENQLIIRQATIQDLDVLTNIESVCFPAAEAASREKFSERLALFADHFWLAVLNGTVIGFINGMVVDTTIISDDMYADARQHNPNGQWQSVFGLNMLPEYRCKGYAGQLMSTLITEAKKAGRKGCILTCKDHMVHYYEKFGYKNLGLSASQHGGARWNDMVLVFDH